MGNLKLFEYTASGSSSITLHADDYLCLETDVFLNDVILDFYLKYIHSNISSEDTRGRVHTFSTYFYKRLTMKTKSK